MLSRDLQEVFQRTNQVFSFLDIFQWFDWLVSQRRCILAETVFGTDHCRTDLGKTFLGQVLTSSSFDLHTLADYFINLNTIQKIIKLALSSLSSSRVKSVVNQSNRPFTIFFRSANFSIVSTFVTVLKNSSCRQTRA